MLNIAVQGSHGDGKTWKMKMVMEKSWNMKNWPKVMECCDQSWNFTNYAPKFYQIYMFFVTAKKLISNLESPHFPMFSTKCRECKFGKRDGRGKSRNVHGKVMDKSFVKYVGTLAITYPHQWSWVQFPVLADHHPYHRPRFQRLQVS